MIDAATAADGGGGKGWFPTTRWSMVAEAQAGGEGALEELCRGYWRPVYAYFRGRSGRVEDAEDLTQGFFADILRRGALGLADAERGKLRTFLLVAAKRFQLNRAAADGAQKRGGGQVAVPLEIDGAEATYLPADGETPEVQFERHWALSLLERALGKVRDEYAASGRERLFDGLKEVLTSDRGGVDYGALGEALGMTEGALRVAVYRLRQRYREVVRHEIGETVRSAEEIDDEIGHLFEVFEGK